MDADTRELVDRAAELVGERATAAGEGASLRTDRERVERALAALALCAARHGGVDSVELRAEQVRGRHLARGRDAAPVVLGEELKDLGAIVARQLIEALGGSLTLEGEVLRVRLS